MKKTIVITVDIEVPEGVSYDLPAQTMREIMAEYENEWRTEVEGDELQPCGLDGCPMCDLDFPGE